MILTDRYRGFEFSYGCDLTRLSYALRNAFVRLELDESTRSWIDDAIAFPHGKSTLAALSFARKFMSDYDANGLFRAYDMRVLGTAQWQLLTEGLIGTEAGSRALDVGAGEGQVTDELRPLFSEVVTTETSKQMVKRLKKRGYACSSLDLSGDLSDAKSSAELEALGTFDATIALNVIDRTARPFALFRRLLELTKTGGFVVCAVPSPIRPHVHVGPLTMPPEESLPGQNATTWEAAVTELAEKFFPACGLRVVRLARVPYLCRGSADAPVGALDDAVFVCERDGLIAL